MRLAFALLLAGTVASPPLSLPAAEAPLLQPAAPDAAALAPVAESSKSPASPSSSETAGEWSEIVDHMRGRLVADTGMDVSGATEVGIFIELENLELGSFSRRIVIFARDRSLQWAMTDAHGKAMPGWGRDVPWTIDYFYVNESVSVPAGGRRRFLICSGNYHTLHEGVFGTGAPALVFFQGPGVPLWHLVAGGDEAYLLRATFKGLEGGRTDFDLYWSGPLSLPPVALQPKPKTAEHLFPARR